MIEINPNAPYGGGDAGHLGLRRLFKLSLRAFRVRPLRTFLTILGIAFGIGTVFFLVSLGYGLQYIMIGQIASTEDSLISIEAFYPSESAKTIGPAEVSAVKSMTRVAEISPVAEFQGKIFSDDVAGFVTAKIAVHNYFRLAGQKPSVGSFTGHGKGQLVISRNALKLLNLPEDSSVIGREIGVRVFYEKAGQPEVETAESIRNLAIAGVLNDDNQPPFIVVEPSALDKPPPFYSRLYVKATTLDEIEQLRDELILRGYIISARIDLVRQAQKIMTAITVVLGVFGMTALIISAIGMLNTMVISFLERIFEVGIMKSIGATSEDIRNLFLMESVMIGLLGGIGGILIGIMAGEIVNLAINLLARYLGGKPVDLFIYPMRFFFTIIFLSGLVGVIAGYWPAKRAAHLSAREAFLRK